MSVAGAVVVAGGDGRLRRKGKDMENHCGGLCPRLLEHLSRSRPTAPNRSLKVRKIQ